MIQSLRFALLLIIVTCIANFTFAQAAEPSVRPTGLEAIHVPEGFTVELAADSDLAPYGMFATFDDKWRLFVTESSAKNVSGEDMAKLPECRVRLLEDLDQDGKFDTSKIFADKLSLPMGALWHEGSLYVASPPDFVRLDDKDGDGISESREIILTGWNVKNTASLHGPFMGPDGWMYLTHGRHGYKIQTKEGEVLEGEAARIWKCRPDGTGLQRVCGGGFDNPVEIIFTPPGEMIVSMTYFTDPRNGQRDALLHMVEGGVYPKMHECVGEFKRTGDLMPVMTRFARIAPAGLIRYPTNIYGQEYFGNLFSAQFNPHRVQRHVLIREGATYRTEDSDFLTSDDPDFHPTDIVCDIDGNLLVVDTGGWYVDACPLSKISRPDYRGGIYRIKLDRGKPPRPDFDLSKKDEAEFWEKLLPLGLWAQYCSDDPDKLGSMREFARSEGPDIQSAGVRALGLLGDRQSIPLLGELVEKSAPQVKLQAAIALGNFGDPTCADALLRAASKTDDRFIEHAIIYALITLKEETVTSKAISDPAMVWKGKSVPADASLPKIQKAALIALDQMDGSPLKREMIRPLLASPDAELRSKALWVASHHPDWSGEVIDYSSSELHRAELSAEEEKSVREALITFDVNKEVQKLVGTLLTEKLPDGRQILLLNGVEQSTLKEMPKSWIEGIGELIEKGSPEVRSRALGVVRSRSLTQLHDVIKRQIAANSSQPAELRVAAIGVLYAGTELPQPMFELLISQLGPSTEATLRLSAAQALGRGKLTQDQLVAVAGQIHQADALILNALLDAFASASDAAVGTALVDNLTRSSASMNFLGNGRLEKLLANYPEQVRASAATLLTRISEEQEGQIKKINELEPLLAGGDVGRGRRIFFDKKAACASCHAVGREGGNLGPDLTTIGQIRSGRDLLEAVIFPSSTLVPGYEPFRIETTEDTLAGIIGENSKEWVVLKTGADAEARIERASIKTMEPSAVSVMPEGLDTGLDQAELLDLFAFLQSLNGEEWLQSGQRKQQRIPLFNGRDLAGWDTFLRDFGLNNDPDKVFSVSNGLLRISGQHYGYLSSKSEARNYKLVAEFKWGEKTWAPRADNARDSGILLHAEGDDQIWPKAIECQLIEGGTGDIIVIGEASLTVGDVTKTATQRFDRPGRNPWEDKIGFRGPDEIERPHGEWNTVEIICEDDRIKISVNGRVTLEGKKAEPRSGKILIQSEGAELYFRQIELYPLR